jgi:hypothetical protein
MAGRGPPPKPAALRQRRNRTPATATLPTAEESAQNDVPALYEREPKWHPKVVEWWASVWRSPMASEFLDADLRGGLYLLADLHQIRWTAATPKDVLEAAKEIRLQEVRFGLSPVDRRRLQWEIARGEEAERKKERPPPAAKRSTKDPRGALKAI